MMPAKNVVKIPHIHINCPCVTVLPRLFSDHIDCRYDSWKDEIFYTISYNT